MARFRILSQTQLQTLGIPASNLFPIYVYIHVQTCFYSIQCILISPSLRPSVNFMNVLHTMYIITHLSTTFNSVCTCYNNIAISTVLVYCIGGLEQDKHPILTFPEVGLKHLDSPNSFKELNTTLLYLKSLMRLVPPHPPQPSIQFPFLQPLCMSLSPYFHFLKPGAWSL